MTTNAMNAEKWVTVCNESDLTMDTGLCALHDGEHIAIFKPARIKEVFALSNFDPFGKASVMSRGIIGSIGEKLVVASPLYKQHFDLRTGACLEDDSISLKTYQVRINGGLVQLCS